MAKSRTIYVCSECGYETPKWMGKCPDCGSWNTLAEQEVAPAVRADEITPKMWEHAQMIGQAQFIQVHPTFLYEGMWNCLVLLALFLLRNRTKFEGELFLIYLIGYGTGRFFIEMLRTDQLLIPGTSVPVSMVVSAAAAVVSGCVIIWKHRGLRTAV